MGSQPRSFNLQVCWSSGSARSLEESWLKKTTQGLEKHSPSFPLSSFLMRFAHLPAQPPPMARATPPRSARQPAALLTETALLGLVFAVSFIHPPVLPQFLQTPHISETLGTQAHTPHPRLARVNTQSTRSRMTSAS